MTIAEFEAAEGREFDGALLALWWDGKGDGRRRMRSRRMLPGRMARGCMLIFTGKTVMWGMRPIGIGWRDGVLLPGISGGSGRALWGSCS